MACLSRHLPCLAYSVEITGGFKAIEPLRRDMHALYVQLHFSSEISGKLETHQSYVKRSYVLGVSIANISIV